MDNNMYVPKVLDVIVPSVVNTKYITYLFLVTQYEELDLSKVL